ncbi:MAG: M23 family metallopeptidase [Gemmatimonadota bacterium]|nr:M23 family metallopeptidase [Gemmatimonadota bacterium]
MRPSHPFLANLISSALRLTLAVTVAIVLAACPGLDPLLDRVQASTPHERYARALQEAGLEEAALSTDWIAASERALREAVVATLPFRETGYFAAAEVGAVGYRLSLRRGQRLVVALTIEAERPLRIFLDLFEVPADTSEETDHVASAGDAEGRLDFEVERDGDYLLRLQPELLRAGRYTVTIEGTASLAFPVVGKDSRAVASFFGADRDAGQRQHQGIDIFAPRGTPAVAAASGIAWVGTNQLGGNVVFLRDAARGASLYYAHLDTQLVQSGDLVRSGDTLGLVGNTGNARTTAPHLHFGIYRRGEGALDPFPFVHTPREAPSVIAADTALLGDWARVARGSAELRLAPGERATRVTTVGRHTPLRVHAASGRWYRVTLPDGASGYVVAAATEPAGTPTHTERHPSAAALRERPSPAATVMDSIDAGERVPVYGRFNGFLYVRAPSGRAGWVED